MAIADLRRYGGALFVRVFRVKLAELVLDQFAVERPHPAHGEILARDEGITRRQQRECVKLYSSPEIFHAVGIVMNHRFDERPAHTVSKQTLAENRLLEIFADLFKDVYVRALLSRFQIERVADEAKVFYGVKPCGAGLVKKDRGDFG